MTTVTAGVHAFAPEGAVGLPGVRPFSPAIIDFLADLSSRLLRDAATRGYPDVATFAFWCRRRNLENEQRLNTNGDRLGRGLVFHIAPGNVPVNFAYSLVAGLLAGNANIVRLPSTEFPQVDHIVKHMARTAADHPAVGRYIGLTRYDRENRALTDLYSQQCDVRVIWGGDQTIAEIRRSGLPARSFDVTFADRYSICVIDAQSYLDEPERDRVTRGFFNDTYLFDQNACTAPHLLIWLGTGPTVRAAQEAFWRSLHALLASEYSLAPVAAVDKLSAAYLLAAQYDDIRIPAGDDNLIVRTEITDLRPGIEEFRASCGFFIEHHASDLAEIVPLVTRRYQTLSYLGVDARVLSDLVLDHGLSGIDRIVPIGRTLDFSLRWDGYNLIDMLSRVVMTQ